MFDNSTALICAIWFGFLRLENINLLNYPGRTSEMPMFIFPLLFNFSWRILLFINLVRTGWINGLTELPSFQVSNVLKTKVRFIQQFNYKHCANQWWVLYLVIMGWLDLLINHVIIFYLFYLCSSADLLYLLILKWFELLIVQVKHALWC